MNNEISWDAKEFIEQTKNTWWYVGIIGGGVALVVLAVFLGWWTFLALVILSVIVLILSNSRPPRMIHYVLNNDGLKEGKQLHKLDDFKSFGIANENGNLAVVLMPKKRFSTNVKAYFLESEGNKITNFLGARLPMEEIKTDFLDKIINFLHI